MIRQSGRRLPTGLTAGAAYCANGTGKTLSKKKVTSGRSSWSHVGNT
jgi:hypothetical protein